MIIFGGLAVVFVGMAAIIGLLYLIAAVTRGIEKAQKKSSDKKAAADASKAADIASKITDEIKTTDSPVSEAISASGISDEELTAVITAAISAYLADEKSAGPRFTVTSFKRV